MRKKISKNLILGFLILASLLFINNEQVLGQNQPLNKETIIYFFWLDGCPACAAAKVFLANLENKYSNIKINAFEVSPNNIDNLKAMRTMELAYGAPSRGVPEFFVGDKYYQGFNSEESLIIEKMVRNCLIKKCVDPSDKTIKYINKLDRQNKLAGPYYLSGLIILIVLMIIIALISIALKNRKIKHP
ncbi:MAG: hypothetical protein AAB465_02235 [Patescibacteria group bacterium]